MMGTPVLPYRGRMPVFDYLSESEVADAYLYLELYPPAAWSDPVAPSNPPQSASATAANVSKPQPPANPPRPNSGEAGASMLPAVAQIFVALMVVAGAVFTLYEVKRSKAPGKNLLDLWTHRVASARGAHGPTPVRSPVRSSSPSNRSRNDAHKQAAWRSRFQRSEYHSFESSWLSRRWEKEDGAV
jgi:hypothetical protein